MQDHLLAEHVACQEAGRELRVRSLDDPAPHPRAQDPFVRPLFETAPGAVHDRRPVHVGSSATCGSGLKRQTVHMVDPPSAALTAAFLATATPPQAASS